jgi:hypothetical protein
VNANLAGSRFLAISAGQKCREEWRNLPDDRGLDALNACFELVVVCII